MNLLRLICLYYLLFLAIYLIFLMEQGHSSEKSPYQNSFMKQKVELCESKERNLICREFKELKIAENNSLGCHQDVSQKSIFFKIKHLMDINYLESWH